MSVPLVNTVIPYFMAYLIHYKMHILTKYNLYYIDIALQGAFLFGGLWQI